MNNNNLFLDIDQKYGRTALRLIRRHERCSRKLAGNIYQPSHLSHKVY